MYLERVDLGPLKAGLYQETIGGHPTPNDPTPNPDKNTSGDGFATTTTPTYAWSAGADGLKLKSNGFNFVSATPKNYSVLHGPYVISDNAVNLAVGDSVQFDWLATGAGDDYDVFGYLLDKNTGQTINLLDSYGSSGNGTVNKSIAAGQAGDYNFVFISCTYDESGGFFRELNFILTTLLLTSLTLHQ